MNEWDLEPGDITTRAEIQRRYGGATQGGIEPSRSSPNIFVFTDPKSGAGHGYKYDGWIEGEPVFLYTGQGQVGDQKYSGRNMSLLTHRDHQKFVRLFSASGYVKGSQAKSQIYLGEFEVDRERPYFEADAPDDNGDERTVIVFRLIPKGPHARRKEEASDLDSNVVQSVHPKPAPVPIETFQVTNFQMSASNSKVGQRREAELVNKFVQHLQSRNFEVSGYHIPVADQPFPLRVDIYDHSNKDIIEAKSSSSREHVRKAIGQLLDYRRYLEHDRLTVLLPKKPRADLLELLSSIDIDCVFETSSGKFERFS